VVKAVVMRKAKRANLRRRRGTVRERPRPYDREDQAQLAALSAQFESLNEIAHSVMREFAHRGSPVRNKAARQNKASFKAVLFAFLKSDKLDPDDRAHLKRWIAEANDPMWRKLEDRAQVHGVSTTSIHIGVIWYALRDRRIAESVKSGRDPLLQEKRKERQKLRELAEMADELARYFRGVEQYSAIAMFWQRYLVLPVQPEQEAVPRVEPPFLRVQQLRVIHEQEAKLLRDRAAREPRPTTRVSRQSGGKGRRDRSREYGAFMYDLAAQMCEMCGEPLYDVVAAMANIAFPEADLTRDEARRAARRATTRSGRRGKTGPLDR
jgi:hypothetical protein